MLEQRITLNDAYLRDEKSIVMQDTRTQRWMALALQETGIGSLGRRPKVTKGSWQTAP